jgi:hypothetical protein
MTEQQRASSTYLLDNALAQARERISAGAAWLDPWTTAQLEAIDVAPAWTASRCGLSVRGSGRADGAVLVELRAPGPDRLIRHGHLALGHQRST